MLDAFWGHSSRPLNSRFVIIVDFIPSVCLYNPYIVGMMFQGLEFFFSFVSGHDLGFIGTEGCLILTDLFPYNWAAREEDEKTRERAKFEQFKRSAFFDCTTKLTTPAGVTEGCELLEL